MYIDFKETIWFRVEIKKGHENEVLDWLKKDKGIRCIDVADLTSDLDMMDKITVVGYMEDTAEQMCVSENDNQNTLEVVGENGNVIFGNANNEEDI